MDDMKLLKIKDVCALTTFSRMQIYNLVKAGQMPRPLRLSEKRIAWRAAAVRAWLEALQPVEQAA